MLACSSSSRMKSVTDMPAALLPLANLGPKVRIDPNYQTYFEGFLKDHACSDGSPPYDMGAHCGTSKCSTMQSCKILAGLQHSN